MSRPPSRSEAEADTPGLSARRLAVFVVDAVLTRGRPLDEAFNEGVERLHLGALAPRDRGFARAIVMTTLRHYGRLFTLVDGYLDKPLPDDACRTSTILITSAAQVVLMASPPHAVVSMAVDLARRDHTARRFDRLINAILRRIAADGTANYATLDPTLDCPPWLLQRWAAHYGDATARAILAASLIEPPLDISTKGDAAQTAAALTGIVLPTGSVRVREAGRIEDLPGYAAGDWWVQDAAAALPVRLLHVGAEERVADLCAAPGGKTAQLAAAGAAVVAVDASGKRMARLTANMQRLGFSVETAVADVAAFAAGRESTFDAVLLDAPCSATGTIRRHPDLLHLKSAEGLPALVTRQTALLRAALSLLKPGGRLVYATCSLEPEECAGVVDAVLASMPDIRRDPVDAVRDGIPAEMISAAGDLRTLPNQGLGPDPVMAGLDGFYAARLVAKPASR